MKQSIKKLHQAVYFANSEYKSTVTMDFRDYGIRVTVMIFNNNHDSIYFETKYIDGAFNFDQLEQVLEKEVNKAITFINSIND